MKRAKGLLRIGGISVAIIVGILAIVVGNILIGYHARAQTTGTIKIIGLRSPVTIRRDVRGIPHIQAQNEHDMFFAQGFVEGQDRLFQLDLLRRAVYGRLSEVFGKATLLTDENARYFDVRGMVARQWMALTPEQRSNAQAFSDGVNAAAKVSPTPVEFRLAMYAFEPWKPQDSLAVGMATVIDLTDTWNDIAPRDAARTRNAYKNAFPLSDPCFDAPVTDGLAKVGPGEHCPNAVSLMLRELRNNRSTFASNEWAAGANHTTTHRALLANDPHLRLMIPGVWYLVDLRAPGYHAAGATLAGTPGVILGHSGNVAWGATNGTVSSMSVYNRPWIVDTDPHWMRETFAVRFSGDVTKRYYRNPVAGIFGVTTWYKQNLLVRWPAYARAQSPLPAFDALDRAHNAADALAALRSYPGPTQNFVVADTAGRVAYQLAGDIPNDPLWARRFHSAKSLVHRFANVPFSALPHIAPSRSTIAWTANNKMYGPEYHLRLSPQFAPPYRAYRIAALLRARKTYDVAYFVRMQMDTLSVLERELARALARADHSGTTADWNGEISPDSVRASSIVLFRRALARQERGSMKARMAADEPTMARSIANTYNTIARSPQATLPWSSVGAIPVRHAFANLGISWLNGSTFAGNGDAFTIHMQKPGFSQSFRAVWDVGNWDAGGISIPQGESGRPGSSHYADEAHAWVAGVLHPLPFSRAAVSAATKATLTLLP